MKPVANAHATQCGTGRSCRRATIYRAIRSGGLPACKLRGGTYAIYPAELRRAFSIGGARLGRRDGAERRARSCFRPGT